MSDDFGALFSTIKKQSKKDPYTTIHKPGDITIGSFIPYAVPTRIPKLDIAIGHPGFPAGRVIELFGYEMSGKSTALLNLFASIQRMGGAGLLIDTEFAFDERRAVELGIDTNNNFAIANTDTIESTFRLIDNTLRTLRESGWTRPFLIGIDSVTAVASESVKQDEFGKEPRVGQDARIIRGGMRKLLSDVARHKIMLAFVNHNISTIPTNKYQKASTSSGGHALKFSSTIRVHFTAGANLMEDKKRIGQKVYVTVEKLRAAALEDPKFETQILNKGGFNLVDGLFEAAKDTGLIERLNNVTYRISLNGEPIEFKSADWSRIVEDLGGADAFYKLFLDWALKQDIITPWSMINEDLNEVKKEGSEDSSED